MRQRPGLPASREARCGLRHPFDFPADKQKWLSVNIRSAMEVMRVKTKPVPVVRCEYAQAEKSLGQLLEESFRLFLRSVFATQAPSGQ